MHHPRINSTFLSVCLVLIAAAAAIGQQVEPSYDLTLQLVIGSNEAGMKTDMPATLAPVSAQIKSRFGFASYRLASTFLGRVANNGTFTYKSTSNIFGQETDHRSQTFLEWSVSSLRGMPTAKGGNGFQSAAFVFGARVPVVTGTVEDKNGKSMPVTNFEQIGLTLNKIGVAESVPTLIGTLNLPGANGTIFLVMTVKAVEM